MPPDSCFVSRARRRSRCSPWFVHGLLTDAGSTASPMTAAANSSAATAASPIRAGTGRGRAARFVDPGRDCPAPVAGLSCLPDDKRQTRVRFHRQQAARSGGLETGGAQSVRLRRSGADVVFHGGLHAGSRLSAAPRYAGAAQRDQPSARRACLSHQGRPLRTGTDTRGIFPPRRLRGGPLVWPPISLDTRLGQTEPRRRRS